MPEPRAHRKSATRTPWAVVFLLACLAAAAGLAFTHSGSSTAQETLGGKSGPAQKWTGSEKADGKGKADGKAKGKQVDAETKAAKAAAKGKQVDAETKAAKAAAKAAKAAKSKAETAAKSGAAKSAKDKAGAGAAKAKCPAGQIFDKRSKGCL